MTGPGKPRRGITPPPPPPVPAPTGDSAQAPPVRGAPHWGLHTHPQPARAGDDGDRVLSQPRPGQHRPCVSVFWPWAHRAPPALPSIPHPRIPPSPGPSPPPAPGPGPDWALRDSGSRAGPRRAHAGCKHRGCPRARSRGSGVPPGQPGTTRGRADREALALSRLERTRTGEGSAGSGVTPAQPRRSPRLGTARRCPRAFPGLRSP